MSRAFEMAWALLKAAMPPFVPRSLDDQIGIGSYRAAYRSEDAPGHTTKYGTGEKLADTMVLAQLADMYPELFVPEYLHPLPVPEAQLPSFTMQDRKKEGYVTHPLSYSEDYMADHFYDYGADGGHDVMPLTYTQDLGTSIESGQEWRDIGPHLALRDRIREMYPLAGALGIGDTKPENWALMEGGLDMPEVSQAGTVKIIDPMFDHPRMRPWYTPEFTREAKRFQQDLPELSEFAQPWYAGLDQYEDPALAQQMLDAIVQGEQANLKNILSPLNP